MKHSLNQILIFKSPSLFTFISQLSSAISSQLRTSAKKYVTETTILFSANGAVCLTVKAIHSISVLLLTQCLVRTDSPGNNSLLLP